MRISDLCSKTAGSCSSVLKPEHPKLFGAQGSENADIGNIRQSTAFLAVTLMGFFTLRAQKQNASLP